MKSSVPHRPSQLSPPSKAVLISYLFFLSWSPYIIIRAQYGIWWDETIQGPQAQLIGTALMLFSLCGLSALLRKIWPAICLHRLRLLASATAYIVLTLLPLLVIYDLVAAPYDIIIVAAPLIGAFAVGHFLHRAIILWISEYVARHRNG